jgi:hypothetical protein
MCQNNQASKGCQRHVVHQLCLVVVVVVVVVIYTQSVDRRAHRCVTGDCVLHMLCPFIENAVDTGVASKKVCVAQPLPQATCGSAVLMNLTMRCSYGHATTDDAQSSSGDDIIWEDSQVPDLVPVTTNFEYLSIQHIGVILKDKEAGDIIGQATIPLERACVELTSFDILLTAKVSTPATQQACNVHVC